MVKYRAPFDAIKRILRSKFVPSPDRLAKMEAKRNQTRQELDDEVRVERGERERREERRE
jgi:hypothetical protein